METSLRISKLLNKRNLIVLGIVLIIGLFTVSYALTKEIIIKDGDKSIIVNTTSTDVRTVLKKANISLKPHDQLSIALEEKAEDGMTIVIQRAHPVTLQVDGTRKEVVTAHNKVKDILEEYEVAYGKLDKIEPALEQKIGKYDTITVVRVKEEMVTEQVDVPYQNVIKYNDDLDKSKVNVVQKGQNGVKEITYRVVYEDGQEVAKEVMEEKVITEAVNEVVEKGTAQYVATSRGTTRFKKAITMSSTAYDAGFASTGKKPGDKGYGITRSGTKVRPGVVAVDPKVIPLGTKLYIESLDSWPDYGFAVAEDTGGAIKGNKIDLFYENSKTVNKYGRRKVKVYILE